MKYIGGLLVLGYAMVHALGYDRLDDEDRGELPPNVARSPGTIVLWHTGFMGGK